MVPVANRPSTNIGGRMHAQARHPPPRPGRVSTIAVSCFHLRNDRSSTHIVLVLITHAHMADVFRGGPLKMEITTRCELIFLQVSTETYTLAETKVHRRCTQISYHGSCGVCVRGGNIGLVTSWSQGSILVKVCRG